jgi:cation-transporting ATPase 13A1
MEKQKGFDYLFKHEHQFLKSIIAQVKVFARVSPKQKEYVITMLKSLGYVTLMCGDGTNDVGALKHAEVGVALLSSGGSTNANNPEYEQKKKAKISEAQSLSQELSNAALNPRARQLAQNQKNIMDAKVSFEKMCAKDLQNR